MNCKERSLKFQELMKKHNIDTFVLTKFDPHQSEYGGDFYHLPKYFAGYTGSQAKLVITKENFYIFTDGRYYQQTEQESVPHGYILMKEAEKDAVPFLDFAYNMTPENGTIGLLSDTFSVSALASFLEKVKTKNIKIETTLDLVKEIWTDRAFPETKKIFDLDVKYAGEDRQEKLKKVKNKMSDLKVKNYIVSSLDDIAYVLNLRGFDIPFNTFFASYLIFEENKTTLFVDLEKVSDVKELLEKDGVTVLAYSEVFNYVKGLEKGSKTYINVNKTNYKIYEFGKDLDFVEEKADITEIMKAQKNSVEIQNIKNSSDRDCAYLFKAIRKIKANPKNLTEIDVANIIANERSKDSLYLMESFDPICAYMGNASMAHYSATEDNCATLDSKGLLLMDTGGHYLDGTTDMTRTISLGEVTQDMINDFTLVLKSHIKIATCKFFYGATGSKIDAIAREPMWQVGRNFNHGVGHGIAFVGPVHEGPQGMGFKDNGVVLEENMILTNEPALYVQNEYGLRTENTTLVVPFMETQDGKFLGFETTAFCPIELDLINKDMLTKEEIDWLNDYHKTTYEKLSKLLDGEDLEFLKIATQEI